MSYWGSVLSCAVSFKGAILKESNSSYKPRVTRSPLGTQLLVVTARASYLHFSGSAGAPLSGDASKIYSAPLQPVADWRDWGGGVQTKVSPLLPDSTDSVENSLSRALVRLEWGHQNPPHLCLASYPASSCLSCCKSYFTDIYMNAWYDPGSYTKSVSKKQKQKNPVFCNDINGYYLLAIYHLSTYNIYILYILYLILRTIVPTLA